jgi:hypothetical protein
MEDESEIMFGDESERNGSFHSKHKRTPISKILMHRKNPHYNFILKKQETISD